MEANDQLRRLLSLRNALQAAQNDSDLLLQQVQRKGEYVARERTARELCSRHLTNCRG
jgi:hypothetical protein